MPAGFTRAEDRQRIRSVARRLWGYEVLIEQYAMVRGCRREFLPNYFGEVFAAPCEACDNCWAGLVAPEAGRDVLFLIKSRVRHRSLGEGMVMRYDEDKMVVLFDEEGYKTLSTEVVMREELLEAAT